MKDLLSQRLKKVKFFSSLFYCLPFIRAIILNGSLAVGKAKPSSDIDLLIITKGGRIFTARFLANLILLILGQKRPKDEKKPHGGKFCLNYFMTLDYLKIPIGRGEAIDRYCADNYSKSILIAGDKAIFKQFLAVNKTLFDRSVSNTTKKQYNNQKLFPIKEIWFITMIKTPLEHLLNTKLGDWLEKKVKVWQIGKIERDPRTERYPRLIAYSDKELRFHPPKSVD